MTNQAAVPTDNWADIISAAAARPLGIAALAILILGTLAVMLFGKAAVKARLAVFLIVAIVASGLAVLAVRQVDKAVDPIGEARQEPVRTYQTTINVDLSKPPNLQVQLFDGDEVRLVRWQRGDIDVSSDLGTLELWLGQSWIHIKDQRGPFRVTAANSDVPVFLQWRIVPPTFRANPPTCTGKLEISVTYTNNRDRQRNLL